jgi:hypothetical protein
MRSLSEHSLLSFYSQQHCCDLLPVMRMLFDPQAQAASWVHGDNNARLCIFLIQEKDPESTVLIAPFWASASCWQLSQ